MARKASSGCPAMAACSPAVRCASNSASIIADRAGALFSGSGLGRNGVTVPPSIGILSASSPVSVFAAPSASVPLSYDVIGSGGASSSGRT